MNIELPVSTPAVSVAPRRMLRVVPWRWMVAVVS